MIKLANILVATDFGEASEAALEYGRTLARTFGARLHVLHVAQSALMYGGPEPVGAAVALQADLEQAAQEQLDRVVRDEDRRDLQATAVLRSGTTPAHAIVSYAQEAAADLIVIGTHGRGTLAHLFMGSVAERVVRLARCPVLTVRHPEHEFVVPDALVAVSRQQR
jgi:nucleotide-binding universal stress UspA family protein